MLTLIRALEQNSTDVNVADEMNKIVDDLSNVNAKPVPPGRAKPPGDRQVISQNSFVNVFVNRQFFNTRVVKEFKSLLRQRDI